MESHEKDEFQIVSLELDQTFNTISANTASSLCLVVLFHYCILMQ